MAILTVFGHFGRLWLFGPIMASLSHYGHFCILWPYVVGSFHCTDPSASKLWEEYELHTPARVFAVILRQKYADHVMPRKRGIHGVLLSEYDRKYSCRSMLRILLYIIGELSDTSADLPKYVHYTLA